MLNLAKTQKKVKKNIDLVANILRLQNKLASWQAKAVQRSQKGRILNYQYRKTKEELKVSKEELKELRARLEVEQKRADAAELALAEAKTGPRKTLDREELRTIAVELFTLGKISARAVTRILGSLPRLFGIALPPIPHHSSVVNWLCRAGIGVLKNVGPCDKPWVAMIDTSIACDKHSVLVVLRVPLDHFTLNFSKVYPTGPPTAWATSVR